jgi:hypothetical protein
MAADLLTDRAAEELPHQTTQGLTHVNNGPDATALLGEAPAK